MDNGKKKVRDIILAQMTILMFIYSRNFSEAFFQEVCYSASMLSDGVPQLYHPYSFAKIKSFVEDWEKRKPYPWKK